MNVNNEEYDKKIKTIRYLVLDEMCDQNKSLDQGYIFDLFHLLSHQEVETAFEYLMKCILGKKLQLVHFTASSLVSSIQVLRSDLSPVRYSSFLDEAEAYAKEEFNFFDPD